MRSLGRARTLTGALALLGSPVLLGSAVLLGPAGSAGASGAARTAVTVAGAATLRLTAVTPSLTPAGHLVLDGVVRNTGATALGTVQAYVRRQAVPVTGATALEDALRTPSALPGSALFLGRYADLGADLEPGAEVPVHLDVTVAELGLSAPGVYPVDLEVRATTPDGARLAVAAERVALPLVPAGRQLPVTVLVPVTERPHRLSRTVFVDDDLAASLAPTGRLGRLLTVAGGPPGIPARVQFVLDPMVLEEVTSMATGYRVLDGTSNQTTGTSAGLPGPSAAPSGTPGAPTPRSTPPGPAGAATGTAGAGGRPAAVAPSVPAPLADEDLRAEHTRTGTGGAVARQWLARFRAATVGRTVLLLPWGDPDPGTASSGRLRAAVDRGTSLARAAGLVTRPLGWPSTAADGTVDTLGLGATARSGGLALVSSAAVADAAPTDPAPTDPAPTDAAPTDPAPTDPAPTDADAGRTLPVRPIADTGGLRVLRSDTVLDRAVTVAGSGLQRRQEVLGQAAVLAVAAQDPAPVLLTLPADWDPARTPVALLTPGLPGTGWVVPAPDLGRQPVGTPVVPSTPAAGPDPTVAAPGAEPVATRRATGLTARATAFASVLTQPQAVTDGFGLMAAQLLSRRWAGQPAAFAVFVGSVSRTLDGLTSAVSVPVARAVTLSSAQGRFPITVTNALQQRVRVSLRLEPRNTLRLDIRPTDRPVDVAPAGSTTVSVRALARSNGDTEVVATVTTADGVPLGPATRFGVTAQHYDTVGWVVIGVASALLFGATAVRLVRRVRAARGRST